MPKTLIEKIADVSVQLQALDAQIAGMPESPEKAGAEAQRASLRRSKRWYEKRLYGHAQVEPLAVGVGDDIRQSDGLA